jgi:hypothetical protein
MGSFGTTIPVTTLNNGFLGNVSRIGKRTITARQVLSTSALGPKFGDPMVIVPDATGGTYQSVADFITAGGTFTAALFAGVAVREVKTNISFIAMETIGSGQIGSYAPGEIAEALEEGSITIKVNVTTGIVSQGQVFVRVSANGANTIVGGFESAGDTTHTVALTGVVWRTGVVDANGVAEITILNRVAA